MQKFPTVKNIQTFPDYLLEIIFLIEVRQMNVKFEVVSHYSQFLDHTNVSSIQFLRMQMRFEALR